MLSFDKFWVAITSAGDVSAEIEGVESTPCAVWAVAAWRDSRARSARIHFSRSTTIGLVSLCRSACRSAAGWPLILRSMAKMSSIRRTASTASGALRRSACSKKWRRPWLQHAASVIGPGLRLPPIPF